MPMFLIYKGHRTLYPNTVLLNVSSPGSSSNITSSMTCSKSFSTMKPSSRTMSKNARSFWRSQGLYGVKNTSACDLEDFFKVCRMVDKSLVCSEWLNRRSPSIKRSNLTSRSEMGKCEIKLPQGTPQRYPSAAILLGVGRMAECCSMLYRRLSIRSASG